MMKRILSFFLGAALIVVLVVPALASPVSAADDSSDWVELLEFSTVNGQTHNTFTMNGTSGSFKVPLQMYTMVSRVDILIWHQSAETITSAKCGSLNLSIKRVDSYVSRVYGLIPTGYYKNLSIDLTKSGSKSQTWEVLSFRYTPISTLDMPADAVIWVDGDQTNVIAAPGDYVADGTGADITLPVQIPVVVNDWQKYDTVTIHGSIAGVGLNSVRASLGALGLPYEMTYTSSVPTGTSQSYRDSVTINHYDTTNSYYGTISGSYDSNEIYLGKTLFTITIDLRGVDRSNSNTLTIWFTGVTYDGYSHSFNVQGVTGSVVVADKSNVSWWNKFTNFMSGLFESNEVQQSVDELQQGSNSISDGVSDIGSFEQSQQDTLNSGFATITSGISFTSFSAALLFVQKYSNMTFNGISRYTIIFTLPLFLGLFFYLCSRIPGITRWKPRPPQSKGGKNP